MRYAGVMGMALVIVFFAGEAVCLGQTVSSSELIAQAKNFDNKTVTYSGEVIGDVMKRGDFAWINVNDGANAIGVWIAAAMAGEVRSTGNFKRVGDTVEVVGIFNRVCVGHGGDLDIHAQSMRILSSGGVRPCIIDKAKKDWAIKLLGAMAIIWILSLLKMR
jgi:hypothetical protein